MFKRVVCTDQIPFGGSPRCARILAVGVSTGGNLWQEKLSVEQVVRQIESGMTFYTRGLETERIAFVEKYWCMRCAKSHIRTEGDSTIDNNLDSLGYCMWRAA